MNAVLYVILRRMRAPLLVLIAVYAVAILGMVLVPGRDAEGNPWHMDFLHAFYFVSYTATTIGFGEIPFSFTPGQRIWTIFCTYLTVVAWIYAIGNLLALLQDPALRQVFIQRHFTRTVRGIREPFFIVCGYGDTGTLLVDALAAQHHRCVVVDIDPDRVNALKLADYPVFVPGLCADAALPDTLSQAGLKSPHCAAVIALTNRDEVNLHVAITSKLFRPRLKVIARAESKEVEDNMASFGTDHVIDPFEAFADRLFTALHAPCLSVLRGWLSGNSRLRAPLNPPHGLWILCGFGRFGKALHRRLEQEGVPTVVVESAPERTGWPERHSGCVEGWGTEAVTLREARIAEAVGIVAGTSHDTNNLSILMTARDLRPELFTVARQNKRFNGELFRELDLHIVMQASRAIADEIRTLLSVPLLAEFLRLSGSEPDGWARALTVRLASVLGDEVPEVWEMVLCEQQAPAAVEAAACGESVRIEELMRDPHWREWMLPCAPLLLERQGQYRTLPPAEERLGYGDRVLFVGVRGTARRMNWTAADRTILSYVRTGREAEGAAWRWLGRHRRRSAVS